MSHDNFMTIEHAIFILENPAKIQEDTDERVIDDHRWIHAWATTKPSSLLEKLKEHNLTMEEGLRKLHEVYVNDLQRRKFEHDSPMKFEESILPELQKALKPFNWGKVDWIGSTVAGKSNPNDIDVAVRLDEFNEEFMAGFLANIPGPLKEKIELCWGRKGASGPYIPAGKLVFQPSEDMKIVIPPRKIDFNKPIVPLWPDGNISYEGLKGLSNDGWWIIPFVNGTRLIVVRRKDDVKTYDNDGENFEVPEDLARDLMNVEDPTTFILDGVWDDCEHVFVAQDILWWRETELVEASTDHRMAFLRKFPESKHLKRGWNTRLIDGEEVFDYFEGLKPHLGERFIIKQADSIYPLVRWTSSWSKLEIGQQVVKAAASTDGKIKELVDSGKWTKMVASERAGMMENRSSIEVMYPFLPMKPLKKGFDVREYFGFKPVAKLADQFFKVPRKVAVETKFDGFLISIHKKGKDKEVFTESGLPIATQLPNLSEDITKLKCDSCILLAEQVPYGEDGIALGRRFAAQAYGGNEPVDDATWIAHVFDILLLDGKDLHDLPYEKRRELLRGLELPVSDVPKIPAKGHLMENSIDWANTKEAMLKLAQTHANVKFSEGAMFKTSESKYLLNGRSSFWAKFKQFFELDAIVLGRKSKTNLSGPKKGQAIPGQWTYVCGYGPVKPSEDDPKILDAPVDEGSLADYVKLNDKIYGVLGDTFATAEDAKVGDILTVDFNLINKFGPTKYHWVLPRVIEKRPEKTKPDPIGVVDGIAQECTFRKRAPTKKAAFPLDTRMGIYSLISAKDPRKFVGVNVDGEWNYAITRIPEALIAFLQKYDVNTYYTRDISPSVEAALFLSDINVLPISSETVQDALDAYEYIDKEPDVFKVQADIWDIKRFYTENPQPGWGSKSFAATMDYLTIPPDGEYAFVAQAHVRGLSVHIDLRIALVRNKELIGWTMDALKSLIKVAVKRYADDAILSKFGLSKSQVDGMAIKDVSQKLNSSLDGRHFMDALSDKIEKLPDATIMTMIHELIKEELLPILDSPERKILLQTKEPEPYEWISYEGRVGPGGVGATAEHAGRFFIVDRGVLEYGAQKEHYHEYWLNGKVFNGHFVVRRLPTAPKWELKSTFAWMGFFTLPDKLPYTITKRAIDKGYMPPDGRSALPAIIRKQVDLYPYWKYKGKEAKNMRDALVTAIKKTDVKLKFARGLKFAIKQFWYRGPVHVRGAPNVFYYLIFHDGNKVLKTFDFGEEDPEGRPSVTVRLGRSKDPMMIKKTGVLPASHILNPNEKLVMNMDTVDEGSLELIADSSNFLRFKLDGGKFKGLYVIYRENPSSEEWFFKKAELPEPIKASMFGYYAGGLGTQGADFAVNELEDILVISGPFLRPGEMIGLDMRPTYFPPQSIEPITITGVGTPIIMMHGDLKGDVVGYVQKVSVKDGVGYCDVGIIFHPKAIKSILSHQTPDFSIELLPKSVWDAEHQREVVLSGVMVGLGIVTRGAGKDLHIQTAKLMKPPTTGIAKKVFKLTTKFGIPLGDYLKRRYWQEDVSTVELAEEFGVSETAVKKMFEALSIPMRTLQESAEVRRAREKTIKKFGGAIQVSFLGTGANTMIPQPGCDCPQCVEARKGGPSRRNHSSMLITYGGENLILDAPEEIVDLLGMKKIIPDHVLITHAHPDHAGGLKFMTNKNLNVYAPANVWDKLENINNMPFHKRVVDITPFKIGPFLITAFKVAHSTVAPAVAYKIRVGEARTFFYAPDVLDIPNKKEALKDVDVFIGDGSALKQEIVKQVKGNEAEVGHASMEDEIGWAGTAEIPEVIFTHIGHVKMGHDELNKQLRVMAPNATAANDGASGLITDENPGHKLSEGHAKLLWEGKKKIIVTTKPYMRYATKVIFFIDEDKVYGRMVEGFPEGPYDANDVKTKLKGLHMITDEQWKKWFAGNSKVYIYRPRIISRFDKPLDYKSEQGQQVYIRDVKILPRREGVA